MNVRLKHTSSLVAVAALFLASIASAGDAEVKDNHLNYNGKKYFRVGSEDVVMGAYGEKKSPLTAGNYLEVQDHLPYKKLKVKEAVVVDIDFQKSTKSDILSNISLAGVFKGGSKTAYEDMKSGKLKLLKLIIENNDLKDAANDSPKAIENLIEYGNDARIVHQVFVVIEAALAKTFASSTSFDVTVSAGVAKIDVKGTVENSGTSSLTLSAGSIFAYGMVKIDWDANGKNKKTKIVKVTDDQWGLN